MYSSIDPDTDGLAIEFCKEAEGLWNVERGHGNDSLLNIAAAEFLCLGYLGQGRDHAILAYVNEASNMGKRLGLFGSQGQDQDVVEKPGEVSEGKGEAKRARMHAAWGVFNWITLSHPVHSLHQLRLLANTPLHNSGSCHCFIDSQA